MKRPSVARLRRSGSRLVKACLARLPASIRSRLYRRAIDLQDRARAGLELKIAETQEELEACFSLLHDAYVASGLMRPHPSGLRVTPYHALPTTTTLCAKVDGLVVGTLSIVRDGVFGFPMQSAFDVSSVRAKEGQIAEISALAIHPRYRKTGGSILFPLMKFMYGYCTRYFDTRHLLIAVHPSHIEMYESLLYFERLVAQPLENYDFVNGAPAVGATLDLQEAPRIFERAYGRRSGARNLHHYFVDLDLPAIKYPPRDWHISNDPVLTPALMDHFFNRRTRTFDALSARQRLLLHSIYADAQWNCLPPLAPEDARGDGVRVHSRFSFQCTAHVESPGAATPVAARICDLSAAGFRATTDAPMSIGTRCRVVAVLGPSKVSRVEADVVRRIETAAGHHYGFAVPAPDEVWLRCATWLDSNGATAIEPSQRPESQDAEAVETARRAPATCAGAGAGKAVRARSGSGAGTGSEAGAQAAAAAGAAAGAAAAAGAGAEGAAMACAVP